MTHMYVCTNMDATTQHMFNLLEEGLIDEHNVRMSYIKACLEKYKYLGTVVDDALIDNLSDKTVQELEVLDVELHGLCTTQSQLPPFNGEKGEGHE